MSLLRNISIQQKLRWIIMVTSSVALLLACLTFIAYELVSFRQSMTREMSIMAEIIGENSTAAIEFNDPSAGEEMLGAFQVDPRIVSACIYTEDGTVFATYRHEPQGIGFIPPRPYEPETRFSEGYLNLFRPITLEAERIGTIFIQSDFRDMYLRLQRYIVIAVIVLLASLLVAFFLSSMLQRVISRPILHLAETANLVSAKRDYSLRAMNRSHDELGYLTNRFNDMLTGIQERDTALLGARSELQKRANELQRELSERKKAEQRIEASLREKEVLLKEIHHRVKNNLQVISSLLYFQSKKVSDPEALESFKESQNRVKSMALIHEKLYQADDLTRIDFAEYIRSLSSYLFTSYGASQRAITLATHVDNVPLGIDKAIPCGLIINELVSNSIKHAFPDHAACGGDKGKTCEIDIRLRYNGDQDVILVISDNGIGFPENIDYRNTPSLGLKLVNTLVQQLDGKIDLNRATGTEFRMTFTVSSHTERI